MHQKLLDRLFTNDHCLVWLLNVTNACNCCCFLFQSVIITFIAFYVYKIIWYWEQNLWVNYWWKLYCGTVFEQPRFWTIRWVTHVWPKYLYDNGIVLRYRNIRWITHVWPKYLSGNGIVLRYRNIRWITQPCMTVTFNCARYFTDHDMLLRIKSWVSEFKSQISMFLVTEFLKNKIQSCMWILFCPADMLTFSKWCVTYILVCINDLTININTL